MTIRKGTFFSSKGELIPFSQNENIPLAASTKKSYTKPHSSFLIPSPCSSLWENAAAKTLLSKTGGMEDDGWRGAGLNFFSSPSSSSQWRYLRFLSCKKGWVRKSDTLSYHHHPPQFYLHRLSLFHTVWRKENIQTPRKREEDKNVFWLLILILKFFLSDSIIFLRC